MRNTSYIAVALAMVPLIAGCGNQMMRQPSYMPLEAPRAAPPAGAVSVAEDLTPIDARLIVSQANVASTSPDVEAAEIYVAEPTLPPPNLSDNARNMPAPKSVDALRNPLPQTMYVITTGKTLFMNRCVQCHNSSGTGYGPVGAYLEPHPPDLAGSVVQQVSDGAMFWHITMGQGKMPPFRTWTTPYERWALASYVRSLRSARNFTLRSATQSAPYPVYGEEGFEDGHYTTPFKVLPASPESQQPVRAWHFDQSQNGGWKSAGQ